MLRKGKVKFWNESKKYGFIIDEETGEELYTYWKFLFEGVINLKSESFVEFEILENEKGLNAINVKPI